MNDDRTLIRVGHSPDPDDAFMFYALAKGKIDTGPYRFEHELADIETLNRRALAGDLELTAVSLHAYAHLADFYVLCTCGASIGDRYGPIVAARKAWTPEGLAVRAIAVPGTLTTAFLVLRMCLGHDFTPVVVPFDRILEAVSTGRYEGHAVDAGLIIHEGQLTYEEHNLVLVADMGQWWFEQTGLPLPLGANVLRKDLGQGHRRSANAAEGEHSLRPGPSRRGPRLLAKRSAAASIAPRRTSSWGCTSTIGRWISVRAGGKRWRSFWPGATPPA